MMRVEIRLYTEAGEFVVLRRQPFDKANNRPQATSAATLKAAYDDAVAWLRRTTKNTGGAL